MAEVTIYSDGGSDPNPGIGGWAAVLKAGEHEKVLTGHEPQTTNNRMELTAAIEALRALKRPTTVAFYTDSEYVRRGITEWIEDWIQKDWKKVQNADLWKQLWSETQQHQIEWHWVKGHAGNPLNERVDRLAREARLSITPEALVAADAPHFYLGVSYDHRQRRGGWGVVMLQGDERRELGGAVENTSNNRLEIQAAVEALTLIPFGGAAYLFTSNDYLFQGATRWITGWKRRDWKKRNGQPVANADLWKHLDASLNNYTVRWINAKGSDAAALKEARELARKAAGAADDD